MKIATWNLRGILDEHRRKQLTNDLARYQCDVTGVQETHLREIRLDLFNDDTRPSGHINRPTQVNVFQSCFHSLNKLLKPGYIV